MSDKPAERVLTFAEKVEGSSQVKSVAYRPESGELDVVYKSSPQWLYTFSGFTPAEWEQLQVAPSVGSWLNANVSRPKHRQPHPFAKVANPDFKS